MKDVISSVWMNHRLRGYAIPIGCVIDNGSLLGRLNRGFAGSDVGNVLIKCMFLGLLLRFSICFQLSALLGLLSQHLASMFLSLAFLLLNLLSVNLLKASIFVVPGHLRINLKLP